ncbi:MAG: hypothetical protein MJ102_09055, partial [Clostridia bacterium]|nr:hypothetical protein [Clostridia bacterium]
MKSIGGNDSPPVTCSSSSSISSRIFLVTDSTSSFRVKSVKSIKNKNPCSFCGGGVVYYSNGILSAKIQND